MPAKRIINIWDKFNRLTIKEILTNKIYGKKSYRMVKCKCECWNEIDIQLWALTTWHTKSCWCYNKDQYLKANTTHNSSHTRMYKIWQWIKNRCNNWWNKRQIYSKITYDKKWETFEWFYEDMKEWYRDDLTIDRIDNNWNYCKENCRWATFSEQNRNHSRNVNLTYNWETMCITDWAKELWVSIWKIKRNIQNKKNKMPLEEFISTLPWSDFGVVIY